MKPFLAIAFLCALYLEKNHAVDGFLTPHARRAALTTPIESSSRLSRNRSYLVLVENLRHGIQHSMSTDGEGLPPAKNPLRKVLVLLRQTFLRIKSYPPRFAARFSKLSRRAKVLVAVQIFTLTLIFGSIGKKAVSNYQYSRGIGSMGPPIEIPYSSFLDLCEKSGSNDVKIENLRIGPESVVYRIVKSPQKEGESKQISAYTRKVPASQELISRLRTNDIPFSALPRPRANTVGLVLRGAVLSFYMLILWRMYKTFSGNSANDAPGKIASTSSSLPSATFNDIQGVDNAKQEVMELVDALRYPEKYSILGARAPTGLLLEGPPGTGKTLLARATAATAGVPLLYCSGSDFVEMFVGRGAARVRKLFERASRMAPCIIFVDELDALGKSRDMGGALSGLGGGRGNDEAEQTLNQLLACMDGLDSNKRICVLAATNRKEVLDPALVRPGRFDRIVTLSLPDVKGRENILRVHARKLPGFKEGQGIDERRLKSLGKGEQVDLSAVAAVTSGFSGAELEFLVNEAAIRAVRRVSSALREGISAGITPHVLPEDFEASLENFYATRKGKIGGLDDVWKNVWRQ